MQGTHPCEMSSAASRGKNCPHKAKDSTEEKGNRMDKDTRMDREYCCCADSSMVSLLSLPLDKTRFYQS